MNQSSMSTASLPPRVDATKKRIPSWLIYSLFTIVLWGIWGATSKAVASDINAYMNQVLFTIGLIPLLFLVIRSPRLAGGKNRRRGIFYAFITGILGGTGNILFFTSLTMGGRAAVVVPMTSLSPLATVILAFLVLREKISASQIVGLGLAFVAIYLLSL
ncbi:MAG TPA: DMT family transporter [Terriglobia bacterium]|nr:DMT family transporter [Terriglobia bacterium]